MQNVPLVTQFSSGALFPLRVTSSLVAGPREWQEGGRAEDTRNVDQRPKPRWLPKLRREMLATDVILHFLVAVFENLGRSR